MIIIAYLNDNDEQLSTNRIIPTSSNLDLNTIHPTSSDLNRSLQLDAAQQPAQHQTQT